MLRKQPSRKDQGETMASKWEDLMQYEKEVNGMTNQNMKMPEQEKAMKCEKLKKMKENTGKKFSLLRDQISGICR